MSRMTRNQFLMGTARLAAQRSTCSRTRVGAVISRDSRILMTGYNGAPAGMPHCEHLCRCWITGPDAEVTTTALMGHKEGCPVITACVDAIHAEQNALNYCARMGIAVEKATLLVTVSPCRSCAQSIIAAGISSVIYDVMYRDVTGLELLSKAKVTVVGYRE